MTKKVFVITLGLSMLMITIFNSYPIFAQDWIRYPELVLQNGAFWDTKGIYMPCVVIENNSYYMWYSGHEGTTSRTGFATSDDGVLWTKYPDNDNPQYVLSTGPSGSFDSLGVAANTVLRESDKSYLIENGKFKMWYHAGPTLTRIGYAESPDGINWTKYRNNDDPQAVLTPGPDAWDNQSIAHPTVLLDENGQFYLIENGRYKMWYSGYDGSTWKMCYAESPDGIEWTKDTQSVQDVYPVDVDDVFPSSAIIHNGVYYLYFGALVPPRHYSMFYAISNDGYNWNLPSNEPILPPIDDFDGPGNTSPHVLLHSGLFKMWYQGGTEYSIFFATKQVCITYLCFGFDPPMNKGPVKVKPKRTLPLKAELFDTNGLPITDADIIEFPVIQVVFESTEGGDPIDVTNLAYPVGTGTEGNQFEFIDGKWRYNLKTNNYTAIGRYNISMISGNSNEYIIESTCSASFIVEF